jgi:hypothetical protein
MWIVDLWWTVASVVVMDGGVRWRRLSRAPVTT